MSVVAVSSTKEDLYAALARAISDADGLPVSGDTVLIKPNLVLPESYQTGQVTNPYLVEVIARWCYDHGAREVIIGEGPGYYQPESQMMDCFTRTGIKEAAERSGAKWVLFDEHPFRVFRNIADCTPGQFHITRFVFDCDRIINVPVMKTHYLTTVTLAMKNLKGCLKREDKPKFHYIDLHRAIVELNKLIRPSLNIVDGTVSLGDSGAIVVSTDIVAADTISCFLMGIDPGEVRHIKLGAGVGLGETSLARMDIRGEELPRRKVKMALPQEELKHRFPLLELVGEKACSGCLIPLFSVLLSLEDATGQMKRPLSIVMGREAGSPETEDRLFIGDCTRDYWQEGNHLEGCPPNRAELARILRGSLLG